MRHALKQIGIVALALLLAVGAASAAVTFDDETTNTATTSDVHATSHVVQYNESANVYLEAQVETTTPAFKVVDPETNETLTYLNGTELTQTYSDTSVSPAIYYYAGNFSQSAVLSNVEMAAGENKTLEVYVINNESATNPTTSMQEMYVHNDGKRTYLKLEDSEVGSSGLAQIATENTLGYQLPWNSEAATIDQPVPVNGSKTTATIDVQNSTLSDRLSQSASDETSGDWIKSTVATVDGEPVKVYMDSAPSEVSNETHIVYHSGSDSLELVTGSDYKGIEADLSVEANRGISDQMGTYGVLEVLRG